ncbi:MFS transporter [Kribbella sp. NPDC058693]|uniref:MFS transporter n=1 Tax=Kribbella sp. NPDC058693 TaxID=3346602 RepID=UPI003659F4A6
MTELSSEGDEPRATIRQVIGVAEFRAVWLAHAQSRFGDQLARVAVAVLVFERTSSPLLTALAYAMTLIPPLVSAPLLCGLADRHSRRRIMVVTDLVRAGLVAGMAVPRLPLVVVVALLVCVVTLQPLYSAARNAVLPNVLAGDRYIVGMGLTGTTDNIVQVVGFATGGLLMGLTGASGALTLDALTFVVAAALIRFGTSPHLPPPRKVAAPGDQRSRSSMRRSFSLTWNDRRLRFLLALVYVYGFYIAPEGLAAPYAGEIGLRRSAGVERHSPPIGPSADPVGSGRRSVVVHDARVRVLRQDGSRRPTRPNDWAGGRRPPNGRGWNRARAAVDAQSA